MRAGFLLVTIPGLTICLACIVYLWWRRERIMRAWTRGVQALAQLRELPRFQRLTGTNPTRAELARLN